MNNNNNNNKKKKKKKKMMMIRKNVLYGKIIHCRNKMRRKRILRWS
jgi:hypothetical protein